MEWLGYVAASLTTAAFVPQAIKTIRTRETAGISLVFYLAFTIGLVFWFGYGLVLDSWPMIVSNAIAAALAATILTLKVRHG